VSAAAASRLILPALTPYDRQLVMQSVRRAVALWGAARIELGGRALVVLREPLRPGRRCGTCRACPGPIACRWRGTVTCIGCALEAAGDTPAVLRPFAGHPAHSGSHSRGPDASRPSAAPPRQ
jgi:hypothetical protein